VIIYLDSQANKTIDNKEIYYNWGQRPYYIIELQQIYKNGYTRYLLYYVTNDLTFSRRLGLRSRKLAEIMVLRDANGWWMLTGPLSWVEWHKSLTKRHRLVLTHYYVDGCVTHTIINAHDCKSRTLLKLTTTDINTSFDLGWLAICIFGWSGKHYGNETRRRSTFNRNNIKIRIIVVTHTNSAVWTVHETRSD